MKRFLAVIFIFFSEWINAQISIDNRIDDQLKLSTYNNNEGDRLIGVFQDREPKDNILDYKSYIGYIFTNFKSENNKGWELIEDVGKKETAFNNYRGKFKNDTLFVNTLQRISDNSIKPIENKPEYSFEKVMDVATKFIKIIDINEDDNYVLKICVGVNDLDKTQPKRFPDIEAFCFLTIFNAYVDKEGILKDEIFAEFHKIVPLNMGIDKQERILRAQGALIVLMYQNDKFREVLLKEYESKKELLPFRMIDAEIYHE